MTAGRPTKYDEKFCEDVDTYLSKNKDKKEKSGIKVSLPTIEGFAAHIGIDKTTLYEWEQKYEKFSYALCKIRQEQHDRLVNNGLGGTYNPTITKLMLSNNHGYRERNDVTSANKPIPLLNVDVLRNNSDTEDSGTEEES